MAIWLLGKPTCLLNNFKLMSSQDIDQIFFPLSDISLSTLKSPSLPSCMASHQQPWISPMNLYPHFLIFLNLSLRSNLKNLEKIVTQSCPYLCHTIPTLPASFVGRMERRTSLERKHFKDVQDAKELLIVQGRTKFLCPIHLCMR